MRRRTSISLYLCILAAWVQLFAPIAAMSMERAVDPFSIICAKSATGQKSTSGKERDAPLHQHQKCDHCLLCHAHLGGAAPAERPAYVAFDHPVASPLRWLIRLDGIDLRLAHRDSQPRAPPQTV